MATPMEEKAPTAEQVFEALTELHPNSGLKLDDVKDFLSNPANIAEFDKYGYVDAPSRAYYIHFVLIISAQSGWL